MSHYSKFSSSLLILFSCLFFFSLASAHNITRILDRDPDFSIFNELLTKTHLAGEINRRKTLTILAVPNDRIGDLASKQVETARTILMNHVVLDYYDILKLQKLKEKSNILTTLYQTTGVASYQQGFLNVTNNRSTGNIVFGSAVRGAPHDVNYLGTVASMPFNISVLSVSKIIVAPGIDGQPLRPIASTPKAAPAPKSAHSPPPAAEAPVTEAPVEAPADAPVSDSPTPSPADSESPADAPVADASASSPSPAADDASDKADSPTSSAMKPLAQSSLAFLVVFASFLTAH
ncbi:hypothetical protein M9H77_13441 [Catharanthus roseus]|uniref:Uncharacterized protein n=1 Tax=Catharanthus roseus TaxID=4058 RepID=A0ACC0BKF9_CATRO|nr:hypothetical protein M9H77_13441 [Catharanthus roseus]